MMNLRRRAHRAAICIVSVGVHALIQLGAPPTANAQTSAPEKSWRERHPVAFATLIGTGAGAVVGCGVGAAASDAEDISCPYLAAPFALLGAAIGVVPGMITERRHEEDALSFDDLSQRLKPGTRVIVVDGGQRTVIGKVAEVSGDSITVRATDNSSTVLPSQGTTWHLRTDSLTNGTLIGAAVGVVISIANYKDGAGAGAISGVPIWALLGALTDRAFGHPVLTATKNVVASSASVHVSPWVGKRSGGIAFSVAF
ncbi:MAG TPA: hypothetical protein VF456_20720 [Vicinamibacterales bacterium]